MDSVISESFQIVYSFQQEFGLWLLLFAIVIGFLLAFAVGANDSANSWGASVCSLHCTALHTTFMCFTCCGQVGAGTVSLGAASVLGCIMETVGAVLLSSGVVSTVAGQQSVVNITAYRSRNTTEWDRYG